MALPSLTGGAAWAGWFIAIASIAFTLWANLRKSQVDESGLVLNAWKDLYDKHEARVKSLVEEVEQLRDRLQTAEKKSSEQASEIATLRNEIADLKTENAQLIRIVAQNSSSQALMLGNTNSIGSDIQKRVREAQRKAEERDDGNAK